MNFKVKPSKPAALLSVLVGAVMIGFALSRMHHHTVFLLIWCILVVVIVGFNVWSAFSANGATQVISQAKK